MLLDAYKKAGAAKFTLLFGKGKPEKAAAIEVKKFKHGLALDLVGSKKLFGIGISKDIYKNDLLGLEVDGGLYITKTLKDFMQGEYKPDLKLGISIKKRF